MARKALIQRKKKAYPVQEYSRCLACGRLRQQVYQGVIPGLKKASW